MNRTHLTLVQTAFDPAPGAMANKYRTLVADAAKSGAQIVVLPEFSLSAYFPLKPRAEWGENEPLPEAIPTGESCKLFAELARDNGVFVVGSVYERGGLGFRKLKGARYDTAVLTDPEGNVGGVCRKQHIPANIGYHESEYFSAGNSDYPVFGLPPIRMAMPTCYDQWFPELARIFSLKGAELLVYPTAIGSEPSEPGFDSQEAWTTILRSHAIANGVFVAAANRVGTEENITFYGSSAIIAPDGTILAQGSRNGEELVSADLAPDAMDKWRRRFPLMLRREPETYGTILGRLSLKTPEEPGETDAELA